MEIIEWCPDRGIAVSDRVAAETAVAGARSGIPLTLIWRVGDKERRDSVIL